MLERYVTYRTDKDYRVPPQWRNRRVQWTGTIRELPAKGGTLYEVEAIGNGDSWLIRPQRLIRER